jgi:WD40 repeat protein
MAMAVTPDSRLAVSASLDKTLRIWELTSGTCSHTLEGHTSGIWAVAITPDGRHAISGSYDATLRIWDLRDGTCIQTLEGHTAGIKSVIVTPDGRFAVSASDDETIKVWDLVSGICTQTLQWDYTLDKVIIGSVIAIAVTPDGRHAISGSDDDSIRVWDLATGRCIAEMHGDGACVSCCTSYPATVISGENTGRVHIFNLENVQTGNPVITSEKRANGALWVQCLFCQKWSELQPIDLGNEITCAVCGKRMRVNPFNYHSESKFHEKGKTLLKSMSNFFKH